MGIASNPRPQQGADMQLKLAATLVVQTHRPLLKGPIISVGNSWRNLVYLVIHAGVPTILQIRWGDVEDPHTKLRNEGIYKNWY